MSFFRRWLRVVGVGWACLLPGAQALAEDTSGDAEAIREAEAAMSQSFAATRYDEARRRIEQAIARCQRACSPAVNARLQRDLGVTMVSLGQPGPAADAFRVALAADPSLKLEDAYASAAVWKIWTGVALAQAQSGAPPAAPTAAASTAPPADEPPRRKKRVLGDDEIPDCSDERPCGAGQACRAGVCEAAPPPPPARSPWWIGPAAQLDLVPMGGTNACSRPSQDSARYLCFRSDEEPYLGSPRADQAGTVDDGLALGTARVMVAVERELGGKTALGARLGYAFRGGPEPSRGSPFLPFHAELRGSYWPLGNRAAEGTIRPFIHLALGVAQFDAKSQVQVAECRAGDASCVPAANGQPGGANPDSQQLDAYRRLGQGFAGLGLGGWLPVTETSGLQLEVNLLGTFPSGGFVVSPSVAYAVRVR